MKISPDPKLWFRTICRKNGLDPSDEQLDRLDRYSILLLEWNHRINLISRKDEENVWQSHLLHSAAILMRTEIPAGIRVLDLGTGGGLPGIPLKILRPDLSFTLLDATRKKIDAVHAMIQDLGLLNIEARWGRAEEVGQEEGQRGQYDLVVARAVASLNDLLKWGSPFLKPPLEGKKLITLKGGDLFKEILHARRVSGAKTVSTIDLALADVSEFLASDKKIVVVEY